MTNQEIVETFKTIKSEFETRCGYFLCPTIRDLYRKDKDKEQIFLNILETEFNNHISNFGVIELSYYAYLCKNQNIYCKFYDNIIFSLSLSGYRARLKLLDIIINKYS